MANRIAALLTAHRMADSKERLQVIQLWFRAELRGASSSMLAVVAELRAGLQEFVEFRSAEQDWLEGQQPKLFLAYRGLLGLAAAHTAATLEQTDRTEASELRLQYLQESLDILDQIQNVFKPSSTQGPPENFAPARALLTFLRKAVEMRSSHAYLKMDLHT